MDNFFPPGFWKTVAMSGMVVFFVLGADLLLGARLVVFLGKTCNKKFSVDAFLIKALAELKKTSDKEFDCESSLLHGWGRFVLSGLLFFGGAVILMSLLPRLS